MFLDRVGNHPRANILYDPAISCCNVSIMAFIDIYHERIKCFHVKDAELRPNGRSGVYGGYQSWVDRPGRFRSLGDGQVDFTQIFSKMAQYDYAGWAVLEWECALKHPEVGAAEGAPFIAKHIIPVTEHAFDDFADLVRSRIEQEDHGVLIPHSKAACGKGSSPFMNKFHNRMPPFHANLHKPDGVKARHTPAGVTGL
jgi:hypothetical protein